MHFYFRLVILRINEHLVKSVMKISCRAELKFTACSAIELEALHAALNDLIYGRREDHGIIPTHISAKASWCPIDFPGEGLRRGIILRVEKMFLYGRGGAIV
uniref:Uncharacterized protein n=1 Tax=Eucampia antarctica TaxID=49252 RepID=A0A7S2WAL5_9STRA|mmetsp:Transcript_25395/g.24340  ORF Transcript_25395/g.24340 Transcript_25395/m.24340 type:complete len:102 (+) Transcript_25395:509-814(+)